MLEEQEGAAQNVVGKIQNAAGAVLGDSGLQLKGNVRQAAGTVQQRYGEALDQVRSLTGENPLAALGIGVAVGVVLGALFARN